MALAGNVGRRDMVEPDGKQEEKLDFTADSEVIGHISLAISDELCIHWWNGCFPGGIF